jgi:hypothetical protein
MRQYKLLEQPKRRIGIVICGGNVELRENIRHLDFANDDSIKVQGPRTFQPEKRHVPPASALPSGSSAQTIALELHVPASEFADSKEVASYACARRSSKIQLLNNGDEALQLSDLKHDPNIVSINARHDSLKTQKHLTVQPLDS